MPKIKEISLMPIDVGFDLKITKEKVILPDADIKIKFLNADNKPKIISGDKSFLHHVLKNAGYSI